ncbi:MAG: hypothetical protein ROW48_15935 [Bellilinea sp.]|jgi:hypothetical protein
MKNTIKLSALLLVILVLLLALPGTVMAQNPPPEQFSGDQFVIGENFTLRENQVLNGSLVIIGANASIEEGALVEGDIAMLGGNLDISGEVIGNLSIIGSNLNLTETAVIRGNIQTIGGVVNGADQARIFGSINTVNPQRLMFNFDRFDFSPPASPVREIGSWISNVLTNVLQILAMAVLALIIGLLMPRQLTIMGKVISDQPVLSGGIGLLTMVVSPLVLIILVITILLIPVAFIAALVMALATLLGWIAVGYQIGLRISSLLKTHWVDAVTAGLGTLLLGVIVWLLGYLFCLGGLVSLLAISIGLGSIILTQFGSKPYPAPAAPIVYPSAPPAAPGSPLPPASIEPPAAGYTPPQPEN